MIFLQIGLKFQLAWIEFRFHRFGCKDSIGSICNLLNNFFAFLKKRVYSIVLALISIVKSLNIFIKEMEEKSLLGLKINTWAINFISAIRDTVFYSITPVPYWDLIILALEKCWTFPKSIIRFWCCCKKNRILQ